MIDIKKSYSKILSQKYARLPNSLKKFPECVELFQKLLVIDDNPSTKQKYETVDELHEREN